MCGKSSNTLSSNTVRNIKLIQVLKLNSADLFQEYVTST